MDLGRAILDVGSFDRSESFEMFSRHLDPVWIARALRQTDTATMRRRKLPAEHAVWIVIGMGLLRDRSIEEVVRHLGLVLPETAENRRASATGSAIAQARNRLGPEPLKALFETTAQQWAVASADRHRWRGLSVYGVDGSSLRIPDTEENEAAFGRPGSSRGRAGYPQARIVALMALRSHLLAGLAIGRFSESEVTVGRSLWDRLPDESLTIVDRGFISYELFHRIQANGTGRHWMTRAKSNLKWRVIERLGKNDDLVELTIRPQTHKANPDLPATLVVRAVGYTRRGFRPQILLTSLLDPVAYPGREMGDLYHERWELEMGFDEIKTHTLEREETLRSRAPHRIEQEIWGLAVGYNLIRVEMQRAAQQAGVPPRRISYRHALMQIRVFWVSAWQTSSPATLPRRLEALREYLATLILPERRDRRYPRAVKIKMSNYALKPAPVRKTRGLN